MAGEIPNREEELEPEQISPEEVERREHEQQWLGAKDPSILHLLDSRRDQYDRKFRLFGVACCNRVKNLAMSEEAKRDIERAMEASEKFADNQISADDLGDTWSSIQQQPDTNNMKSLAMIVSMSRSHNAREAYGYAVRLLEGSHESEGNSELRDQEYANQMTLVRDIFHNPFAKEPVGFDLHWRTSDVVGVARGIYEDKEFGRMPILADALMDAGCEDEEIIKHCRGECEHVRGCWVLDLILQKE